MTENEGHHLYEIAPGLGLICTCRNTYPDRHALDDHLRTAKFWPVTETR